MSYPKVITIFTIIILVLSNNTDAVSQTTIIGTVIDADDNHPLAYVNIGIKEKNLGTISKDDGSFSIDIPPEYQSGDLTFSLVGYYEKNFPIQDVMSNRGVAIKLKERATQLKEVVVTGKKLVEKKYGIKRRGAIHFTDGIFKKDDSFEIGQVIRLGNALAQVTSLNLHINASRPDSASFRINFYRYDADENIPKERLIEKSILQRHPVNEGWLKFDLTDDNILLKGDVLISIEFIPETEKEVKQIYYEVKIGGASKSFFRKTSLGQWTRPPHHYCLYATAITEKSAPDDPADEETAAAFTLRSGFSSEPLSLFVRVPRNYSRNKNQTYPVIYLLDGNAYFDVVASFVDSYVKKKKIAPDPIVVGIGYENAYSMDSLRNRDYTFPKAVPADSFKVSGQGDKFYDFIRTRLVPYIDSAYRTDKSNRTIMGHSLGGYFVLYALARNISDSLVFNNFIAASPSIYYHDNYLAKTIRSAPVYERNIENITLYLTFGELEISGNEANDSKVFSKILSDKRINSQTDVYKGLEHMGTAIPTFETGVQLILSK